MKKYTLMGLSFATVAVMGFGYLPVQAVGSPVISSINPTIVFIDSTEGARTVQVNGANFDQDSYVLLDGATGTTINPSSQSASGLVFLVPTTIPLGTHSLQVGERNSSLPFSNSFTLTVSSTQKATDGQSLLDQINALLSQITATQSQITQLQKGGSAAGQYSGAPSCLQLSGNLTYRSRDGATGGVSALQNFLQAKGYLNSQSTGFFGAMTTGAVKRYQADNGISATGYVGPITRTHIKEDSCGSGAEGPKPTPMPIPPKPTPPPASVTPPTTSTTALPTLTDSSPQAGQFIVGSDIILQWGTKNADTCTAVGTLNGGPWTDGAWSGAKPASTFPLLGREGSIIRFKSAGEYEVGLNCTGPAGSARFHLGNFIVSAPANAPTISYSISPTSIYASNVTDSDHAKNPTDIVLTWTSTNATACGSSAGPAGSFGPSGSATIYSISDPAVDGRYYYGFACSGPGGVMNRFFTIPVIQAPPVTVSLSASPTSIPANPDGKWSIVWSSTGATQCIPSGNFWYGQIIGTSGSFQAGVPYQAAGQTLPFGITCKGPGRSVTKEASITFTNSAPATPNVIDVTPSHVNIGGTATITWNIPSTLSNCIAGAAGDFPPALAIWSGAKSGTGSLSTGPLTQDDAYIFGLNCGGVFATSAGVTVGSTTMVVPPQLNAWPQQLRVGETSNFFWNVTNAKSCTAFGAWSGQKAISGSETITAPSAAGDYDYTLACTPTNGTAPQRGTQSTMRLRVTN